jgi:hypothetical protein
MADTHVTDLPQTRLQHLSSSMIRSAQAYTSVAVDEIELTSNHEAPSDRNHYQYGVIRMHKAFKVLSRPAWLRKLFWKDTWSDVKSFPWRWLGRRFSSHILPLLVTTGMLNLLVLMSLYPAVFTYDTGESCKPDGTFLLSFDHYTPWKHDAIFAININSGRYTFSEAKLIDICWDVVGRDRIRVPCEFLTYLRALVEEARRF